MVGALFVFWRGGKGWGVRFSTPLGLLSLRGRSILVVPGLLLLLRGVLRTVSLDSIINI